MMVKLLADHFGPDINARAGAVLEMDDERAEASIAAGYAEPFEVPLEGASPSKRKPKPKPKSPPKRATAADLREKAVKGPAEA
jgi:hypothetical protein